MVLVFGWLCYFRLDFYQTNQQKDDQQEREVVMCLPELSEYKDVHGGMVKDLPPISHARLQEYLALFGKKMSHKIEDLYQQRY